ncbi:hypothetical protein [Pedobacter psychroterrae]|uniref:Uncharacterized protein n=1 Tax=Pedobacter psychroterrae TaxID=2530453 RepID=A0A4R0NLL8_9SPHI|nr:hypothetical protein [Pedobacter psychroterrae]TCC99924.1 hypothetical protein EZ437_16940 [Pedobacter psychroterrae]
MGNKKVVCNSFKVTKEAIDELETRFQQVQVSGNKDEQFRLIKPFFAVAASGDAKFINRLLNFHKTFPMILENESEFLSKWQQCLRDFLAVNNANALK